MLTIEQIKVLKKLMTNSAKKYVEKIPWMTDSSKTNKQILAANFSSPIKLTYLEEYEKEFCAVFEEEMKRLLK